MAKAWVVIMMAVAAYGMDQSERELGVRLKLTDLGCLQDVDRPNDVKEDEIVAVKHQGEWIYARVQMVPKTAALCMGLVNYIDPRNNFGGRAINFKRHVKKLLRLEKKKQEKTQ